MVAFGLPPGDVGGVEIHNFRLSERVMVTSSGGQERNMTNQILAQIPRREWRFRVIRFFGRHFWG